MPITCPLESTSARAYSSLPRTQLLAAPEGLTGSSETRRPPPGRSESEIRDPYALSMFLKMYKSPPKAPGRVLVMYRQGDCPHRPRLHPRSSEPSHYEAVGNVWVPRGKLEGWREIKAIKGQATGPFSH